MTESSAAPDSALLPAPLQGCLYCHAEGTTSLGESRPLFGLGGSTQTITCSACGAVALYEPGAGPDEWRIRYRNVNKGARFYYALVHLGQAGWLDATMALEVSRNSFVQRQRVQQTMRGDLTWLPRVQIEPLPPLMSPDETIWLMLNPASLYPAQKGSALARSDNAPLDTGRFYVTDRKLHLLGHRRDWSHKMLEVQRVDYNPQHWRIYLEDGGQYYQGTNLPNQIDAQLFATVVKILCKKD